MKVPYHLVALGRRTRRVGCGATAAAFPDAGRTAVGGRLGDARHQAGEAEVEQLHESIVLPHHDVLGLDIPVDHAGRVRHPQRARHLTADSDDFLD